MVDIATLGAFLISSVASFFMAWAIGAGSSGPAAISNPPTASTASYVAAMLVKASEPSRSAD